jgi:hypothetical protein
MSNAGHRCTFGPPAKNGSGALGALEALADAPGSRETALVTVAVGQTGVRAEGDTSWLPSTVIVPSAAMVTA